MTLQVIVGGQYGSEGKGAIAAWLAADLRDGPLAVRVAGPNAGHTVYGGCPPACQEAHPDWTVGAGHPWKLRHVPVAAVSNTFAKLAIAAGSEVDLAVLSQEIADLDSAGYAASHRITLDRLATVLSPAYQEYEAGLFPATLAAGSSSVIGLAAGPSLVDRIGSTGKGVGAARAALALRQARQIRDVPDPMPCQVGNVSKLIRESLQHGYPVQIEGTQGYGLGLHAGHYPYCTSSNCTAADFMAMAGVPAWLVPQDQLEVWVVFRTRPIRVAGNSGPLQGETTWEELGLPAEYTTVTRKIRRVGAWDPRLARQAMEANGHRAGSRTVRAALTMADHVIPGLAGQTEAQDLEHEVSDQLDQLIASTSKDLGALVSLVGTGPQSVIDLRYQSFFAGQAVRRRFG